MRAILLSSICLALAACSPPAADSGGAANTGAPAASTPAPAAVAQIRPGRWKKVITAMGTQSTEYECVTSEDLNDLATGEPNSQCTSAGGFQLTAEGMVYEATCSGEGGGGSMRTVMTGDLQNSYVANSTITGDGPAGPMSIQMRIEGVYEGSCRGDE